LQGDELLNFQYPCASSPRDEPLTTGGSVLGRRTRSVPIDKVLRFCQRDVVSRPVGRHQQGLPPREQAGDLMGPWHQPGTHRVPRQGDAAARGLRACGKQPRNRRPNAPGLDSQMLRFCQAGHCGPSRQARTNRNLPHGSALAANRDPRGFLGKGDVMIHRPCLVAWPVGSEWRTRRPD
jgi:hypothetical protein